MKRTRWIWLAMSNDGRALVASGSELAAFLTRDDAKHWAQSNLAWEPKVVKVLVPEPAPHD